MVRKEARFRSVIPARRTRFSNTNSMVKKAIGHAKKDHARQSKHIAGKVAGEYRRVCQKISFKCSLPKTQMAEGQASRRWKTSLELPWRNKTYISRWVTIIGMNGY